MGDSKYSEKAQRRPKNCSSQTTPWNITVQDAQMMVRKATSVSKLSRPRTEARHFTPCSSAPSSP